MSGRESSAVLSNVLAAVGLTAEMSEVFAIGTVARVSAADVPAALAALRDGDTEFAFLVDLFGCDTGEAIEVTYHLRSFTRDEEAYLRTTVPYDGELLSVWRTYPAALYQEREVAELLGVTLVGHPNPARLLTTDEVTEPLLRKSVAIRTPEEVHER
jgi:NADH:ubiquinone oxidoreductase subunit C